MMTKKTYRTPECEDLVLRGAQVLCLSNDLDPLLDVDDVIDWQDVNII